MPPFQEIRLLVKGLLTNYDDISLTKAGGEIEKPPSHRTTDDKNARHYTAIFILLGKLAGKHEYVCNVHLSKMSPFWLK